MINEISLIVGGGEIGYSLYKALKCNTDYPLFVVDLKSRDDVLEEKVFYENIYKDYGGVYIMHVCIPYSDKFIEIVEEYKKKYNPRYIVVHSTVPVGTSKKLNACHSPCVGLHPFLEKSFHTFTKFLSGKDASEVADYFRRSDIKVYLCDKTESTEYMKIMSTTFYGMLIEFTKQVKKDCNKMKIPFELFTLWNMNYNDGYEKLGHPEYKKPLLVPIMKKIGAHCVLPNTELIKNDFTNLVKKRNKQKDLKRIKI